MEEKKSPANKIWATVKKNIILITVFVAALAAFLGNIKTISEFFSNLFSPKKITITGTIINSDNTPAENARVALFLHSKDKSDSMVTFSGKGRWIQLC